MIIMICSVFFVAFVLFCVFFIVSVVLSFMCFYYAVLSAVSLWRIDHSYVQGAIDESNPLPV